MDMAGNVWELVEEKGVLHGGGWYGLASDLRATTHNVTSAGLWAVAGLVSFAPGTVIHDQS